MGVVSMGAGCVALASLLHMEAWPPKFHPSIGEVRPVCKPHQISPDLLDHHLRHW
jgi:hypothetical protein